MRKLTDSERDYLIAYWFTEVGLNNRHAMPDDFKDGFIAALSYNQAKLDKLISYIKGEITRSEIEDILK